MTAVPAAQYLRMSTDHQQYSLDNQADAISHYAEAPSSVAEEVIAKSTGRATR